MKTKIFSFLFFFSLYSFGQQYYYVTSSNLKIRSGPGTVNNIIGQLKRGDSILLLTTVKDSVNDDWGKIQVDETTVGYISTTYLSSTRPNKKKTNSSIQNNNSSNSDQSDDNSSSKKSKNSTTKWGTYIFLAILVIVALFKIFSGSSKSSQKKSSPSTPKVSKTRWYYCEYCGEKYSSVSSLTSGFCYKHPNGSAKGKHKLYEGSEKSQYACKYCGKQYSSLTSLTSGFCYNHPNGSAKGKHSPAL